MRAGSGGGRRAAFTILEILLALALLGILSAALVSVANQMMDRRSQSPVDVFWEAVREARRMALKTETTVQLRFDEREKTFVIEGGGTKNLPVKAERELTVTFLPSRSIGGAMLIGGDVVESGGVPAVSFYGDGTCMPFRAQFRTTGPAQIIAIDPWTCAPILEEKQP